MSRTWEVLRFELAYQAGRTSTRIYFAVFAAFVIAVNYAIVLDGRRDGYFFNAPIVIALVTVIASMLALLVTAGLAGDAATRDAQLRIDPLLFTTPLGRNSWLIGRALGTFVVTAALMLVAPLTMIAATRLPGAGPFRIDAYLASYVALALPNAFVASGVLFAVAALTRRALGAYAGAAGLFFATAAARGYIGGRLGNWNLAALLDPLGFTRLMTSWTTYDALQKNTRLVETDFANRLLWIAIALAMLTLAARLARVQHREAGANAPAARAVIDAHAPIRVGVHARSFDARARVHQLFAIAFDSLRDLHKSRVWWIVPLTAALFIATARQVLQVELGTPGAATSARVAAMFGGDELTRMIAILIAVSAGELLWRERDARISGLASVTPVPEWLSLLGRFLALALMLVVATLLFFGASVVTQTMLGDHPIQPGVLLAFLFGFQLSAYLLFAALALFIHAVIDQKYVANVVAIVAWFGVQLAREIGVEHHLLLYGSAPEPAFTEMGRFGGQTGPWLWFTFYWSGWALLLAVLTYLFSVRGEERGPRQRLLLARRRLTKWPATIAIAALAVITGAGGFVFYNTNVLNRYSSAARREQRGVEYERRYGRYASLAQPLLAAASLIVEFHAEERAAMVRGTYALVNRSSDAIRTIHVVCNPDVATNEIAFDRAARLVTNDENHGYRIYALANALRPGQSLRMRFTVVHAPRGFTNRGWNPSVSANGSWIQHRAEQAHGERQWLPMIGYQRSRALRDDPAPLEDIAARSRQSGREQIMLDTIVGTDANQTGVAPGRLLRTWTARGRRYFHYRTDAPISNIYAIYSARYAVERTRWNGIEIEVLHHPSHTRSLARMLRAVRAALDYHTRHFAPYPHRQLRLVQYPSSGGALGLSSYPGLIEYSDGYALAPASEIDLPFAVMAHEIGHQWWGHQLVPAPVEGAPLLTESLAWYSAMMTIEHTRGRAQLARLLDAMHEEERAPQETRETSLLRARSRFDAYRAGPFALCALRNAVGEDRVNAALRHLLARFDRTHPPYPTSLDLYAELRAATPKEKQKWLEELFGVRSVRSPASVEERRRKRSTPAAFERDYRIARLRPPGATRSSRSRTQ